jgi:hypothetical protein
MVPGFVYESCTDQIRSEPIPQLIFGLAYLLILTRFIWPLQLPLSIKILVAALALVALQFHRWSKLSSGSVFSPEFPRLVVVLFNWAFGAIVLLALLQLALDVGLLVGLLIHGGIVSAPDGVRYGLAAVATVAAAVGVHQAMRIPPLKDIEVGIHGLPRQFDGYTILQLTDTGHLVRDLAAVLEGAPKGAPVILLDHQPSDARNAAKLGVALQLSGHTHGRLILGIDRLAARANAGYVSGRYDVDGMTLYVNNGTGLWPGFALRLGRPSELTRITLRQAVAT